MDDLHIPAGYATPAIRFEFSRHRLGIHGDSCPENAMAFYSPIGASLHDYLEALPADGQVDVNIGLRSLNSSSTKLIRSLVKLLDRTAAKGPSISVDWLVGEDDNWMLEFGIDLKEEHQSLKFNTVVAEPT